MADNFLKLIEKGRLNRVEAFLEETPLGKDGLSAGLCVAALWGHLKIVFLLVEKGADVNFRYNENWRPLHYAARGRNLDIVNYLLSKGAEIEPINDYGRTPLIEAASTGDTSILKSLIDHGADVNRKARVGGCAVAEAAWNNRPDAILVLAEHGADICVPLQDDSTLLEWATRNGHTQLVEMITGDMKENRKFDLNAALIQAARRGDVHVISSLIARSAKVNSTDKEGNTPLIAAVPGSLDAVVLLLSHGANPYVLNKDGKSAFSEAARYGREDILSWFMDKGISVYSSNNRGESPLIEASLKGNLAVVERLVAHPEIQIDRQSEFYSQSTALTLATRFQHVPIVNVLLSSGADMFIPDKNGLHAVHYALLSGDKGLIDLFVKRGTHPETISFAGKNAIMLAISDLFQIHKQDTLPDTISWLISRGVDINENDHDGKTALMLAVQTVRPGVVHLLLRKGAQIDAEDHSGRTPLFLAVTRGEENDRYARPKRETDDASAPIIYSLLENGADPNHGPVLARACSYRCPEVIEKLVAYGADVNRQEAAGWTPLMGVTDSLKIARCLVRHGANIHATDQMGRTALHHIASAYRDVGNVISFLVSKGADVNAKDNLASTPLLLACRTNRTDTVEKLIALGADLTCVDKEGNNALDIATHACQSRVVDTLKKYGELSHERRPD